MLPQWAGRVFNTPLLIQRAKLDVVLTVLAPRLGVAMPALALPWPTPAPASARHVAQHQDGGIAVVPIHGTLVHRAHGLDALSGLTAYSTIAEQLQAALDDPAVHGIVLDVDSAGGEAAGLFDLADRITAARAHKPLWAVANDAAFSAAYALASAAERVFVTRTAGIGSIGVIALHVDQSQHDAAQGLQFTAISAGTHKNDGSPHAPLGDTARGAIQAEVDRLYGLFVDTVAAQRGLSAAAVRATQAALFFGADGVHAGLADRVGTLEDAVAALQTVLHLPSPSHRRLPETLSMTMPSPADAGNAAAPALSPATPPVLPDLASLRAQAQADALAVAELCDLAGRADLTASYLAQGLAPEAVRQRLLAARAASPEISSHLAPGAVPASAALDDNPIVQAARARATAAKAR